MTVEFTEHYNRVIHDDIIGLYFLATSERIHIELLCKVVYYALLFSPRYNQSLTVTFGLLHIFLQTGTKSTTWLIEMLY